MENFGKIQIQNFGFADRTFRTITGHPQNIRTYVRNHLGHLVLLPVVPPVLSPVVPTEVPTEVPPYYIRSTSKESKK